jgi:hypothetical protein
MIDFGKFWSVWLSIKDSMSFRSIIATEIVSLVLGDTAFSGGRPPLVENCDLFADNRALTIRPTIEVVSAVRRLEWAFNKLDARRRERSMW